MLMRKKHKTNASGSPSWISSLIQSTALGGTGVDFLIVPVGHGVRVEAAVVAATTTGLDSGAGSKEGSWLSR